MFCGIKRNYPIYGIYDYLMHIMPHFSYMQYLLHIICLCKLVFVSKISGFITTVLRGKRKRVSAI